LEGTAGGFAAHNEADWRRAAEAALKGAAFDRLISRTADGISLEPLYARCEGPRALRARPGAWKILARLDHPEAGAANDQALEDIAGGADGLQVAFAGAAGAYGYGLASHDAASLHRAFASVSLTDVDIELDLGAEAGAQAIAFANLVERVGARPSDVAVAFGLDPIGALARTGRAPGRAGEESRGLAEIALSLQAKGFAGPFIAVDARWAHAAGGAPAQELGVALATALDYLRALSQNGFALEDACAALSFRLAADADEFFTLAKFRALRLLWARAQQACGLAPRAARIHAESAWRGMSARDPYVNVMRGAVTAFAAGLGGADAVSVLPFTQAIGLPDALARRLARNTQLVLLKESNLGFVADPAAGAGVFEALTRALCDKAWAFFQALEAEGGAARALRRGGVQRVIADAAAKLARDVATLKAPLTGVSAHPNLAEAKAEVLPASAPPFSYPGEAVAAPAAPLRLAEPFERLRDASDAALARDGARPRVFLATIGAPAAHGRRAGFARELFEAGGIEASADEAGAEEANEAATRFVASGALIACLCGADDDYGAFAESFAAALKRAGARGVVLAGRPGERESEWRGAGIDDFIFAGCDALAALERAYAWLGGGAPRTAS